MSSREKTPASAATSAPRPEFVDVSRITPILTGCKWQDDMRETVTIRAHNGNVIDVLAVCADGSFLSSFGRIRREDLGEYTLRLMGRWRT